MNQKRTLAHLQTHTARATCIFYFCGQYSRDRTRECKEAFAALDANSDGYLTASDLVQASAAVGQAVSEPYAQHMIALANSSHETVSSSSNRVKRQDFLQFLAPPDP